ncbi:MAG TPA: LysR family transcriptional regulator [Devosiaceae bacterium]|jgi:DNA-binding transcriptional LysR family regulator
MSLKYFDTKQLEAFSAVVSIGNMTGAAKAIGRSQPVITRLIQDLEAEVGFSLLHRNGPRFTPTAQGIAFYEQVEVFLSGLRVITEKAATIARGAPLPVEIASVAALATSLLPAALASLPPELFPGHIHVNSTSSENVVQAVIAGTADLGLASSPLDNPGVEVHCQDEISCQAVVASDHPLARYEVIQPQDLRDARLIVAANPYRLRMQINEALSGHGITPSGIIESNTTYVSLSLARKGLGIALVEPLTGMGLSMTGLTTIPLSFVVPFRWSVITAMGRPLTPVVKALIQKLCEKS